MRDFFEDLGKRLGETAETVTNKAGDAIEIQRLKGQIRGLARGNAVDLMELGRTIYDRYKAGEELEESAKALCDAIKDRETTIGDYERKIAKIKGSSECAGCGKMVARDMVYCPYCGEKMPVDVEDAEEEPEEEADAEDFADTMREKAADAAEKVGEAAKDAAEKAEEAAKNAAKKAGEAAKTVAQKAGEAAEKAADKVNDTAEKIVEKLDEK